MSDTDKATIVDKLHREVHTHDVTNPTPGSDSDTTDDDVATDAEPTTAETAVHQADSSSSTQPPTSKKPNSKSIKDAHHADPRRLLSPKNAKPGSTRKAHAGILRRPDVDADADRPPPGPVRWDDDARHADALLAYWSTTGQHEFDDDSDF
jgi:hypothetical protein